MINNYIYNSTIKRSPHPETDNYKYRNLYVISVPMEDFYWRVLLKSPKELMVRYIQKQPESPLGHPAATNTTLLNSADFFLIKVQMYSFQLHRQRAEKDSKNDQAYARHDYDSSNSCTKRIYQH